MKDLAWVLNVSQDFSRLLRICSVNEFKGFRLFGKQLWIWELLNNRDPKFQTLNVSAEGGLEKKIPKKVCKVLETVCGELSSVGTKFKIRSSLSSSWSRPVKLSNPSDFFDSVRRIECLRSFITQTELFLMKFNCQN